ncbi:hypothetical protein [Methanobrevibacter sp.]|uniref:hypothetical protein n=1 Tax=Methanobrevibacter sp. TaxID=66852 RepID=UPI00260C240F|nr:hypothetical protein [uncultured Methanobrevibacter sp.]
MNEDKKTEDICEKLREATGTKNMNTDRTSKKLQTNHIKMKAEELTQDDFSNENCCDDENCEEPKRNMDKVDAIVATSNAFLTPRKLSPTRYLKQLGTSTDVKACEILEDLKNDHKEFLKAKYNLYKTRSEFYSNKENWDKCKEKTGKQSDGVFKEYFQSFDEHRKLMIERENAEFKYNQCLRVFESLLK